MNAALHPFHAAKKLGVLVLVAAVATVPATAFGQARKKTPTSKLFVADVAGDAQIDTGETIEELSKKSVYNAQGTVIETKPVEKGGDESQAYSTMVYSNGTGAFFDADTRVELKQFVQEPFTPNRSDTDVEPSISQTQAFVARGAVGLCTSKLIAGSSMVYHTSQGSVNIRGRKVVIEAQGEVTKVSMLEGDSTVRAGNMDMGGHTIHAGEQAIIRKGPPGQPNIIQIARIPEREMPQLDQKVSMACMAKKTVYFDVQERSTTNAPGSAEGGQVTAFNGDAGEVPLREIVPILVVPSNVPANVTNSDARRPVTPKG